MNFSYAVLQFARKGEEIDGCGINGAALDLRFIYFAHYRVHGDEERHIARLYGRDFFVSGYSNRFAHSIH